MLVARDRGATPSARPAASLVLRPGCFDHMPLGFDEHGFVAPPLNTDGYSRSSRLALLAESVAACDQNTPVEALATEGKLVGTLG